MVNFGEISLIFQCNSVKKKIDHCIFSEIPLNFTEK